ncbi:conserved hypothetical protein [Treponema primitia ZAS-2]|uniref:Metal-binding protein n=1 Tax=Treponema primitia (strain ATCC BAA-887 / DSM 12427 / ZAS-2) TaxID=545694 RepID=F5YPE7_TREPZ|nr:DUF2284 domain-containing protein [Treponema primitia]AEF83706.1 conserved hypothetical protein [Treponema primitia ZAS-2]
MPDQLEKIKEIALDCGFSHTGILNVDTIKVRTEVRDACAVNKCGIYNKKWSCPPGCGTLDECEARIRKFKWGILVQTTGILEDSLDYETMEQTGKDHGQHMQAFAEKIRKLYPSSMVMGSGGCRICETCAFPDEPCRFPQEMNSSMEAYGLLVSDVCQDNKLPYYYGNGTLTYTGCVLLE